MATLIRFLLTNYSLTFLLIALLSAGISIIRHKQIANRFYIADTLLAYFCLFVVGFCHLYNFVMHVFFSKMAASFIGWQTSPFQKEVGFASLGFALVGFIAFRRSFDVRLAAVAGISMFLWGAAGGHIYQIVVHHNFSPGNASITLWSDCFLPVIGFALLLFSRNQLLNSSTKEVGIAKSHLVYNRGSMS